MTRQGYLKHKPVIEAWANGAEVQVQAPDGNWDDMKINPNWTEENKYRIKPKEIWVNLYPDSRKKYAYDSEDQAKQGVTVGATRIAVRFIECS